MIEIRRQGYIRFGEYPITAAACAAHKGNQQADRQQHDERQPGQPTCLLFAPRQVGQVGHAFPKSFFKGC
jgi:hypothetical protein